MRHLVGFVHALPSLVHVFEDLCQEEIATTQRIHVSLQPLHDMEMQRGALDGSALRHFSATIGYLQDQGVSLIVITCSFLSSYVEDMQSDSEVAIIGIDTPMVEQAIHCAEKVYVLSTVDSSRRSIVRQLEKEAQSRGRAVEVRSRIVDAAYEDLLSGDNDAHDRRIVADISESQEWADVIVLSQASMGQVFYKLPNEHREKVLTSPPALMRTIARTLAILQDDGQQHVQGGEG